MYGIDDNTDNQVLTQLIVFIPASRATFPMIRTVLGGIGKRDDCQRSFSRWFFFRLSMAVTLSWKRLFHSWHKRDNGNIKVFSSDDGFYGLSIEHKKTKGVVLCTLRFHMP